MEEWDVSSVTTMSRIFAVDQLFNGDISKWDVSSVKDMSGMFLNAALFNGDISKWDVSSVKDMYGFCDGATSFNSDISKWDISSVTSMDYMFQHAKSFNRQLCGAAWVDSKATKFEMFDGSSGSIPRFVCKKFSPQSKAELQSGIDACLALSPTGVIPDASHGPIEAWDVSHVADMSRMFAGTNSSFNGDISKWDVSKVTDMSLMLSYATFFDRDISKWKVSRVTTMSGMFHGATAFNSDISKWDVSSVTVMSTMFKDAKSFNSDISKWDVSRVTSMDFMFRDAVSFKHQLCGAAWLPSKASKRGIFMGSSGSILGTVCTSPPTLTTMPTTREHATRRPLDYRELVIHTLITTSVTTPGVTARTASKISCPKCSTFAKSGRASCCAPGGAWFKNCGGAGNRKVEHRWIEGVEACSKRKFTQLRACRQILAQTKH